jgi:hypothetical protein
MVGKSICGSKIKIFSIFPLVVLASDAKAKPECYKGGKPKRGPKRYASE